MPLMKPSRTYVSDGSGLLSRKLEIVILQHSSLVLLTEADFFVTNMMPVSHLPCKVRTYLCSNAFLNLMLH